MTNKKRIVAYLDQIDKELLENRCKLLKLSVSFFTANCILEKLGKPILEIKPINDTTKEYTLQLFKIGNNLNQLARKLNSGAKFMIADQQAVLENIKKLNTQILEIQSKI